MTVRPAAHKRLVLFASRTLARVAMLVAVAWGGLALWFDGPGERVLAALLAAGLVGAGIWLVVVVRPLRRALLMFGAVFGLLLAWWLSIAPSNDREWQADVARAASVTIDGSRVTIRNVRDFTYGDGESFTEHWETRTYDLDEVLGVDMFISYWGPTLIAHTIASWEFADGRHLAVSIETRKEKGEEYSAVRGFFRQYEIYYVVADEHDVIGVRAKQRGEQLYLYRLTATPANARALLLGYLQEIDRLDAKPEWYNALSHNCTTTIRHHAQQVGAARPFDWRIIVNGFIDEMGYERGTIDTSLPFEELRRVSDITERARSTPAASFSDGIRVGLPGARRSVAPTADAASTAAST